MRVPDFSALKAEWDESLGLQHSFATDMHPDPRLFKYLWWVFWEGSTRDGSEFLTRPHALCTAEAMALIDRLVAEQKPHWVYNRRLPRREPGVTPSTRPALAGQRPSGPPPCRWTLIPIGRGFAERTQNQAASDRPSSNARAAGRCCSISEMIFCLR